MKIGDVERIYSRGQTSIQGYRLKSAAQDK
jgi:hypothetical protein